MEPLYNDIIAEIHNLRRLKRSVFDDDFNQCDLSASNICLSADILLIPLYWYITISQNIEPQPIEEYMLEQVSTFEERASSLIPRLMKRTRDLDKRYPSKPFQQYRALLKKCFPQYTITQNQK